MLHQLPEIIGGTATCGVSGFVLNLGHWLQSLNIYEQSQKSSLFFNLLLRFTDSFTIFQIKEQVRKTII